MVLSSPAREVSKVPRKEELFSSCASSA